MPRVAPFDRPATYDDLVALPEPLVAEIVDGELHASPRPAIRHARTATVLGGLILPPTWGGGGWWMLDEPELHLRRDVLVPDLAGWRRSRMPHLPDGAFFTEAPDWVCEILSPSTEALDRAKKLRIYARESVGHAWLLDPVAQTFEVLRLEAGRWSIVAVHVGLESVRAEPFEEVEVPLAALWGDE